MGNTVHTHTHTHIHIYIYIYKGHSKFLKSPQILDCINIKTEIWIRFSLFLGGSVLLWQKFPLRLNLMNLITFWTTLVCVCFELPWAENPSSTVCDIWKQWMAVSTLLDLISSVYHYFPTGDRTSNHRMQSQNSANEPTGPHCRQALPN